MPGKKVSINYQYFEICSFEGDQEELYDLQNWIEIVIGLSLEEKIKDVNGIMGRVEDITLVHNDEFYAIDFMRLDVISNTYIVQEDAQAEHIDLEDGEYIGRNTVVIYDPRLKVLMIQCNRGSYGVKAIESYINSFLDAGNRCFLRPVFNNFDGTFSDTQRVTKFDIRFANVRNVQVNNRHFERMISACNETECVTAHIEIGVGYNRESELDKETISEMIVDARQNRNNISSARIVLNDDGKSSIIDLFDNVDHDIITYTVPPRGELAFGYMADTMAHRYDEEGSRARIANALRER